MSYTDRRPPLVAKTVPPLALGELASRLHRVRSMHLMAHGWTGEYWCGQSFNEKRVLFLDDDDGMPVCGTCEGRAIGAGQIPGPDGTRALMFWPTQPLRPCEWETRRQTSYYVDYFICGRRSRYAARRDAETLHVCRQHEVCAWRKGYEVTEIDPRRGR